MGLQCSGTVKKPVRRWFLKLKDGSIIDGPFKTRDRAVSEQRRHCKLYRFKPLIRIEMCKPINWKTTFGDFEGYGY